MKFDTTTPVITPLMKYGQSGLLIHIHRVAATREPTLRAFCFENSAKQSLLHWAGGPKPVFNWMKEETKQQSRNVFPEWPRHGVSALLPSGDTIPSSLIHTLWEQLNSIECCEPNDDSQPPMNKCN